MRKALDRVHAAKAWPTELEGSLALWFVLDRIPDIPESPACRFLKALPVKSSGAPSGQTPHIRDKDSCTRLEGMDARNPVGHDRNFLRAAPLSGLPEEQRHVRDEYLLGLADCGIAAAPDWLAEFRRLFASGRRPGNQVLLFPGAGHPGKQWPLVQFIQLADLVRSKGLDPLLVLGPAELERGLIPADRPFIAPADLDELTDLLLSARGVVGADTGPMHLAGMLGVPGVSLFGPTDHSLWGPVGMRMVNLGLDCAPCTTTCSDLDCREQLCMRDIAPQRVMMELEEAIAKSETGFQDPGFLESRLWQKEEE
ncbi:MAG: glycosyltransferase family 9 protein [Acidobacteriota bacterium]